VFFSNIMRLKYYLLMHFNPLVYQLFIILVHVKYHLFLPDFCFLSKQFKISITYHDMILWLCLDDFCQLNMVYSH
jgi:hypothetical protein